MKGKWDLSKKRGERACAKASWLEGAWMVIRIRRSVWLACREQAGNMEERRVERWGVGWG